MSLLSQRPRSPNSHSHEGKNRSYLRRIPYKENVTSSGGSRDSFWEASRLAWAQGIRDIEKGHLGGRVLEDDHRISREGSSFEPGFMFFF